MTDNQINLSSFLSMKCVIIAFYKRHFSLHKMVLYNAFKSEERYNKKRKVFCLSNSNTNQEYGVKQIQSLQNIDAVRQMPAMYLGNLSETSQLVYEILDNSIDEFAMGFGDVIDVHIYKDFSVEIRDRGRGIPVGPSDLFKDSNGQPIDTLTGILTSLNSSGKYNNTATSSYQFSIGAHGVGSVCVNACSDKFIATVKRNGHIYRQEFAYGVPITGVEIIGDTDETGTTIFYHPDKKIYKVSLEPSGRLEYRLSELASLNSGLTINYTNDKKKIQQSFYYQDGINGYTLRMIESKSKLYEEPFFIKGDYDNTDGSKILVEISFLHDDESEPNNKFKTFVNNVNTTDGGTHLQGFRQVYREMINQYGIDKKLIKDNLEMRYLEDGMYVTISIKISHPEFEGQTKNKLCNDIAKEAVGDVLKKGLTAIFKNKKQSKLIDLIIDRANKTKTAEIAARQAGANSRKAKKLDRMALPGKLADCANHEGQSELYLVEGDSAAGCLTADTLIHLANGHDKTIKSLVEDHQNNILNYVFSSDENGHIFVEPIQDAFKTKHVNQICRIVLDNDKEIRCTIDHKFLLRDGSYKEAQSLTKDDNLMPLYAFTGQNAFIIDTTMGLNGKYEFIRHNDKKEHIEPVHKIVARQFLGKHMPRMHIHHKDCDSRNNYPENLMYLSAHEHMSLHRQLNNDIIQSGVQRKLIEDESYRYRMTEYFRTEQAAIKREESKKRFRDTHPEWKTQLSEKAKLQWQNEELVQWRREKTRQQIALQKESGQFALVRQKASITRQKRTKNNAIKYYEYLISNNLHEQNEDLTLSSYSQFRNEYNTGRLRKEQAPTWQTLVGLLGEQAINQWFRTYNHKIKSVEILNEEHDVYDLTVPPFNNFALSSGVFVHNSAKSARWKEFQSVLPLRGKILNVSKADMGKILNSEIIKGIVAAIGGGIGDKFDVNNIRYDKIIMMCFVGNTKVKMLDGTIKTFEELAKLEQQHPGQEYWVYSCKSDGTIMPGKMYNPRITRYVSDTIKVILDDGGVIESTVDHRFMLRDGTYKEAQHLQPGESLMSLYTRVDCSTGHEEYGKCHDRQIIAFARIHYNEPIPMYCGTVEDYHNFAVVSSIQENNVNSIICRNSDSDSATCCILKRYTI